MSLRKEFQADGALNLKRDANKTVSDSIVLF